jgi:hypothetical protein
MAYRSDLDALEARDQVLSRELAEKQREHAEVQQMLDEARTAEADEVRANDVLVGRRRLRRIALAVGAVVVIAGVAGVMVVQRHPVPSRGIPRMELVEKQAAFGAAEQTAYDLALAAKGLHRIDLEPRPLGGMTGFETTEEVDAALGATQPVVPWQPFIYTRDAQARMAIASPVVELGDTTSLAEFVTDGHGGIWRTQRTLVPTTTTQITVDDCEGPIRGGMEPPRARLDRHVWLLPLGSGFRGDLLVEVRAPKLDVHYALGDCPPAP